jgi:plastocyanin
MRRVLLIGVVVALGAGIAVGALFVRNGRGANQHLGDSVAPTARGDGSVVHRIAISGLKFEPAGLEVNAGDIVEWTNADFVAHTATAEDQTFDTGTIEGGKSKRITAEKRGSFPYSCRFHPLMKGTLTVR